MESRGPWHADFGALVKAAGDLLTEGICDYGESWRGVLGWMLAAFVVFTFTYWACRGVLRADYVAGQLRPVLTNTSSLLDVLQFSLGATTTLMPCGLEPSNGLIQLLTGLQALASILLTGLLGFVIGNRIRHS